MNDLLKAVISSVVVVATIAGTIAFSATAQGPGGGVEYTDPCNPNRTGCDTQGCPKPTNGTCCCCRSAPGGAWSCNWSEPTIECPKQSDQTCP